MIVYTAGKISIRRCKLKHIRRKKMKEYQKRKQAELLQKTRQALASNAVNGDKFYSLNGFDNIADLIQ